ncbi:major facilitator superfamily domain-containing protein [Coemansia spiralis]|nr:major facilitator superfamily domain-containing protein [Coemansia spiralis]
MDIENSIPNTAEPAKGFPRYTRYAVIVGCFVIQALSCGTIHAFGVQQEYLTANVYAGEQNKIKALGYIGTLMFFGIYIWGMLAGWLAEVWSYRKICFIGVVIMALGQVLASFCREPWQLCITEGIIYGLGGGLVYSPTSTAPARWFTKRRGLATGFTVAGVGVGGLVIAPLTEFLVSHTGIEWSFRISGFYILVLGTISCFFVRVPTQDKTRTLKRFDWVAFYDKRFAIHALMVFFVTAAYIVPYMYLPEYWVSKGLSAQTASTLIAVGNVSSSVGRVVTGFVADYIGVLNTLLLTITVSSLACLLVWPFATSVGVGVVMALLYGFPSGGYWSLAPLAAGKLFGIDRLASTTGIFYTVSGVGAWLGNPVANALLHGPGHSTSYLSMSLYIGVLWAAALLTALTNRISYSKALFASV